MIRLYLAGNGSVNHITPDGTRTLCGRVVDRKFGVVMSSITAGRMTRVCKLCQKRQTDKEQAS